MAGTTASRATSPANDDDGWEDVPTESQVVFDTIGDVFTGKFTGWTETTGNAIPQAHFENSEGQYFVNCGWSLKTQLRDIKKGTLCRITYIDSQDTGQKSPMMIFKVQTKK